MDRYKFQRPWFNREPGSLVDESELRLGIIRTLISMNVLVKVEDEKLDSDKDERPTKPSRKPRASKKASAGKRVQSGRSNRKSD